MKNSKDIHAIVQALKDLYPDGICSLQYQKDYELLFATRLSAQCTDERVNQVTPALFARFPTLEALAEAEPADVEPYIHSCGFFRAKAKDIVFASRMLLEQFHGKVPGTMEELLSRSDVIVLCAPSGDKPLVDAASIAAMKDGVVIINVSRGANVDEAALLDALNAGKVRAAGLDVWVNEKEPNWALVSHPAVSCTPHIGAGTKEAQKRIGRELVDLVEHFEA